MLITIFQYQVLAAKSPQLLDFHVDLVSLDAASKVCVSSCYFIVGECILFSCVCKYVISSNY
jgi:hypothetical protein